MKTFDVLLTESFEYPSEFEINQDVYFILPTKYAEEESLNKKDVWDGRIVAVRFTEMKALYDIQDKYFGRIYNNIDSGFVKEYTDFGKNKLLQFVEEMRGEK